MIIDFNKDLSSGNKHKILDISTNIKELENKKSSTSQGATGSWVDAAEVTGNQV